MRKAHLCLISELKTRPSKAGASRAACFQQPNPAKHRAEDELKNLTKHPQHNKMIIEKFILCKGGVSNGSDGFVLMIGRNPKS
jgi:hypothetical protein